MSKRILIADDARIIRSLIISALKSAGYEIAGEAKTGREAVSMFTELKPDLVTMDLIMPEMEGMEALKEILKIDPQAKIIVLTSLGQQLLADDAVKAGALGFIAKPFQPHELVKAVRDLLGE